MDEFFDDDAELEESLLYDFVFVDEAQDLDPHSFRHRRDLVEHLDLKWVPDLPPPCLT